MGKKKENKVVEAQPSTALVEYTNVNFDDLNKSITKLGQYKGRLSKEDKKMGTELLDDWQENVISRINQKEHELELIEGFFGIKDGYYNFQAGEYQHMRENMATLSNTGKYYTKWLEVQNEVELHKLKLPQQPEYDPEKSEIENDKQYTSYHKEKVEYDIERKKLAFAETKAWNKWLYEMKKSKEIKDFLSKIVSYRRQLNAYKNDCKTKTHMAKVNLAISNDDVRASIQELLEFSEKFRPMK